MAAVRMQIATTETGVCVYDVRSEFDFHLIIIESQIWCLRRLPRKNARAMNERACRLPL